MKKLYIFALVATLFAACVTDETQDVAVELAPETLTVSFEEADSRIQLNEAGKTVWTKGDEVSVFYLSNANQKWQYQGKTGERTGNLKRVENATATHELTKVVVVYPYNSTYYINPESYNVKAQLPATQTYLANSYGVGGNIMISQGEYNQFSLKSACGWLKLQLTGNGEKVKSIKLKGNNGEQVAGEIYINSATAVATLAAEMGGADDNENTAGGTLVFDDTILTEVVLDCGEGVELGTEPTAFYIGLPPQTFAQGLTIEIEDTNALKMTKSTDKEVVISRNAIQPMAAFDADFPEPKPANNEIWYTSTDGSIVTPNNKTAFGVNLISNTYENGKGILVFDGNVTNIGYEAFDSRSSLRSVTIPDSVTSIGYRAFAYCYGLNSITIPDSITSIGGSAFDNCSLLTNITIPDSVTSIGKDAFNYCTWLTSVTIPDSVTSIGGSAFYNCYKLKNIYYQGDLSAWCKINFGDVDSNPCSNEEAKLYIDGGELFEITLPSNITEIKNYTFCNCTSLTSVTIPDSVTSIGDGAFYHCDSLKSITIPDSVTSIGSRVFQLCDLLTSIIISNNIISIGEGAFYGCGSLKSITIPDSVTSIGGYAFYDCTSLTSVAISNSVTSIQSHTFYNCKSLTSITIPDSVTSIGEYAFYNCKSLTNVTIGNSVTSIGNGAFKYCSLKEVYCKPTTPPMGGSSMFQFNVSGCKIYVPRASVEAYKAAEYWSGYSTSIVGYDFARLSLAPTMSDVLNVPYSSTLCTILLKADVEYEVVIPSEAKSWLYYNNKISQNGDYDEIQIRAYENTTNASRSATVTFKQIDGNLSTSVTINQAYFEGVDDSSLDPTKYLTYVSNYQRETSGDVFDTNIYIKNTYFTTGVSNIMVAEYKFQLPSSPSSDYSLSDDCLRVSSRGIEFWEKDDGYSFIARHTWETLGASPTDVITIRLDKTNQTITVNGVTKSLAVEYTMGRYIFSSYYRDSDDGVYEEYGGFMNGARLYYAKGWDANGRLIYLGHASKATNSATGNIEACWESHSSSGTKTTFAFNNTTNYSPLGMGNL